MKSFGKLFNTILSSAAIALPSLFTVHFAFGDGGPLENISILDSTSLQKPAGPEEPENITPTAAPEPASPVTTSESTPETTSPQSDDGQSSQDSDDDDNDSNEDEEDEDEEDEEEEEEQETAKSSSYTNSNRKVVWGNFPSALKNAAESLFSVVGSIAKRRFR